MHYLSNSEKKRTSQKSAGKAWGRLQKGKEGRLRTQEIVKMKTLGMQIPLHKLVGLVQYVQ